MQVVRLEFITRGNWQVSHLSAVSKLENCSFPHGKQEEWSADAAVPGTQWTHPVWFAFATRPTPLLHEMH